MCFIGCNSSLAKYIPAFLKYLPRYSKVSIIRPGHSRLLEFEKKNSTGRLIETFFKYPDQVV